MNVTRDITAQQFADLHASRFLRIISDKLDCDLRLSEGRFVMRSIHTGVHSIDAASTDLPRLNAHWQGFCRNARLARVEA